MLCDICSLIDFDDVFYPKAKQSNRKATNVWPAEQRPNWRHILVEGTSCTFCAFLVEALSMNKQYEAIKRIFLEEAPDNMANDVFLNANPLGTVSLPDHADAVPTSSGWLTSGRGLERHVRYVWVALCTSTERYGLAQCSAFIFAAGHLSQARADRVLHYRPARTSPTALKRLVELWLAQCLFYHEYCDFTAWTGLTGVRMIDTLKMCIVPLETHVDYIALSYCWGSTEIHADLLKLTMATLPILEREGSIKNVGRTISDAISLAKLLKIRYLWVDMLCIVQDDEYARDVQINHMDAIYKHAALTVVAAAGADIQAGLPGIRSRPVNESVSTSVSGRNLIATLNADTMANVLMRSTWKRRAWTLQEHLLSKRCLIFSQYEVFFECECARFREVIQAEFAGGTAVLFHEQFDYPTKPNKHDLTSTPHVRTTADVVSPFQRCCTLIDTCSKLRIGHEGDRLKAMTGILNDLSPEVPGGFWWGLPLAAFEVGLCFTMGRFDNDSYSDNRRAYFPSWCPLGWITAAEIHLGNQCSIGYGFALDKDYSYDLSKIKTPHWTTAEVAFHRFDGSEWREIKSLWLDREHSVFFEESRLRWVAIDRPTTDHTLAFWTQVVYLNVDMRRTVELSIPGGEWAGRNLIVRDMNGHGICHLGVDTAYRHRLPQKLKFALVAQNRRFISFAAPRFDLLHIETVDGISVRTGEVRDSIVTLEVWQSLEPQWELIFLV